MSKPYTCTQSLYCDSD